MTPDVMRASVAAAELDMGKDFVIVEWTAPPSANGSQQLIAPLHMHRGDDEAWYVLEGSLGFSFDGREFTVPTGGGAVAKAGVVHTYWNAASTSTRYLIIMTPRIRELIAVLHDPEQRGDRTMEEVFEAYDSVLLQSP